MHAVIAYLACQRGVVLWSTTPRGLSHRLRLPLDRVEAACDLLVRRGLVERNLAGRLYLASEP
jgi:DNA-binding IclR family transcriptional regulator